MGQNNMIFTSSTKKAFLEKEQNFKKFKKN